MYFKKSSAGRIIPHGGLDHYTTQQEFGYVNFFTSYK